VPAEPAFPPPLAAEVGGALLARRVVLLHGELEPVRASEVAASLMTLDALGDEHVELRVTAASASFDAALVLLDVMGVLGVPVHTVGTGVISGGAVGVVAAGARRVLSRHARLHLREPDLAVGGRASEIERALAAAADRRDAFLGILVRCTGRSGPEVEADWAARRMLSAEDAVVLGYADSLLG